MVKEFSANDIQNVADGINSDPAILQGLRHISNRITYLLRITQNIVLKEYYATSSISRLTLVGPSMVNLYVCH